MAGKSIHIAALVLAVQTFLPGAASARVQTDKAPSPSMAALNQYLIPDGSAEIALARSAAPSSIADAAEVMVLTRDGYTSAAKGSNGFVGIVERSWAKPTDDPEFWNVKVRAPNCFNPAAARTFLPIYLMKTKLVMAGTSKDQILAATTSALKTKELPAIEPGAMCYMMAKGQYLSDADMSWHPHLMFFVPGDAVKSWGANLPGSPLIAGKDPEERVTIFMVMAGEWSDGSPAQPMTH